MTALSLLLAVLAFALFGLATPDHHRKRIGRALVPAIARRMRIAAWGALIFSFPPAILAQGWVFGPILWVGLLMLGAGSVFLILNLAPARDGANRRRAG
ncbi:DUF3325 domain-containing protein [Sphingomonas suaedae]|uniref:DUF3325 domain-containing protein n=1 Tax=Sphingomonas suaedae TaxID=2599297 RepID=A0A518RJA3_9SPHN|nr:DUF3325 domain-containing protein [Sphingomonas suaedae]QDX27537.1 DUF3325 domain-containing protein [Sphingomonas suaedae]